MKDILAFTLPNGIRVIHQHSLSPVAYCGLTINAGTRDELPHEHGMAHFLEHVLFKGTAKRKAYHINNRLENVGGELNAFTTKEETVIHATTLTADFSRAMELIADIAFHSVFPEKEIVREKEVICEEIDSYRDSPTELIFDDFEDLLFRGSSLGRSVLGDKRSVRRFKTADVQQFIARTYNTDQMIFSSVGNISENRLHAYCCKYLGQEPANLRNFVREELSAYLPFQQRLKKHTHQLHGVLGNRTFGIKDKRQIVLALLTNLLGGPSANSILNTVLREKHGLVYSIDANCTVYNDVGSVSIYYGTAKQNAEKGKELILEELRKIGEKSLTGYQLAKAKKQFIGQLVIASENDEFIMLSMGKSMLNHGRFETMEEVIRQINDISISDINTLAQEVFEPSQLSELIYY